MKRSNNAISPFIILLIPVLLVIGLLALNPADEEETTKIETASCFSLPVLQGAINVIF